jgi:hypothetical protein
MEEEITEIKRMNITEFREFGLLQELNRQYLHPLGLALEVVINEDGTEQLGGIQDWRDDPEGLMFAPEDLSVEKMERVRSEWQNKDKIRRKAFGWNIQPVYGG